MDTKEAGRLGGLKKSERKTAACRENAKRPRKRTAAAPAPAAVPENGSKAVPVLVVPRG